MKTLEEEMCVDDTIRTAESALADLKAIEALGYPTHRLHLTASKLEIHLHALRRTQSRARKWFSTGRANWHTGWLVVHSDTYWRLRDEMP